MSFGVRWSGFIRPSLAQRYTLHAAVVEVDERIKLWVDNRILINQWSSLKSTSLQSTIDFATIGGYYLVLMEYKQVTGPHYGTYLKWSSGANIIQETITKFWWDGGIKGSSFRIKVLTGGGGSGETDSSENMRGFIGNHFNSSFIAGSTVIARFTTPNTSLLTMET